jgi:hypothetical protein
MTADDYRKAVVRAEYYAAVAKEVAEVTGWQYEATARRAAADAAGAAGAARAARTLAGARGAADAAYRAAQRAKGALRRYRYGPRGEAAVAPPGTMEHGR